jgi:hypothetical protein
MKKQVFVSALTLGLSLTGGAAIAQERYKVVDTIADTSLKFIQSALPELTRYGLKLDGYRIVVIAKGRHHFVVFEDLNMPPGRRGSTREKLGFEVELNEEGEVVHSQIAQ